MNELGNDYCTVGVAKSRKKAAQNNKKKLLEQTQRIYVLIIIVRSYENRRRMNCNIIRKSLKKSSRNKKLMVKLIAITFCCQK